MYSHISNSIRESILELRIYSDSSKLIMSICLRSVSLNRGCEERARILPQPGGPDPKVVVTNKGPHTRNHRLGSLGEFIGV